MINRSGKAETNDLENDLLDDTLKNKSDQNVIIIKARLSIQNMSDSVIERWNMKLKWKPLKL